MPILSFMGASIVQHDAFPSNVLATVLARVRPVNLLASLLILAAACGGDQSTGPASLDASRVYWSLQVNYQALNLATVAPYNTVQLTVTPLNAEGGALTGLGPVVYTSADSTVTVSPTGLVTARYATAIGTSTLITVSLQDPLQSLTYVGTVFVQVTDTVPRVPIRSLSMQPGAGDSTKRSIDFFEGVGPLDAPGGGGGTFNWAARCDGTTCPILVNYRSSNPSVATFDNSNGAVRSVDTGRTVLTASTWAYGIVLRDSVPFTIGPKLLKLMTVVQTVMGSDGVRIQTFPAPKRLVLGVGAIVAFLPSLDPRYPVDIVFDKPTLIDSATTTVYGIEIPPSGAGNIPPFSCGPATDTICDDAAAFFALRGRRFPHAGTYTYRSSRWPSAIDTLVIQ